MTLSIPRMRRSDVTTSPRCIYARNLDNGSHELSERSTVHCSGRRYTDQVVTNARRTRDEQDLLFVNCVLGSAVGTVSVVGPMQYGPMRSSYKTINRFVTLEQAHIVRLLHEPPIAQPSLDEHGRLTTLTHVSL